MTGSVVLGRVLATSADQIAAPNIDYGKLAPTLLVLGAAVVSVGVEAFAARPWRVKIQVPLAFVSLAVAFIWTIALSGRDLGPVVTLGHHVYSSSLGSLVASAVAVDGPTLFIQGVILILAMISLFLVMDRQNNAFTPQASALPGSDAEREHLARGTFQTEIYPLVLFAVGGMLIFAAAADLLTMFVALEVMSLPLYLLCGLARRRRLLSQEASVKYFLLGAFSSAFFLYGTALLYGYAGSVRLKDIADVTTTDSGHEQLLLGGLALLAVGLLFKIGAVPFQAWKPDVYQGAPTPITALMASTVLVAAFGATLRVFMSFENMRWDWRPMMWGVAIITMIAGAVVAITQTDVKRMLAYSSIAHAGFLLTGVIAVNKEGVAGTLFYLAAYGFTTIGAFAIIMMVRDSGGEAAHLSRWAGLGKRSPLIAGVFAFFLLAFAGIPLTSGFTSKFAVFRAAVAGGATPLVVVGVISSAIAAFFYLRVIVVMFFSEPETDGPSVVASIPTTVAVAVGVTATVVLGVLPQPILDLAGHAANQVLIR